MPKHNSMRRLVGGTGKARANPTIHRIAKSGGASVKRGDLIARLQRMYRRRNALKAKLAKCRARRHKCSTLSHDRKQAMHEQKMRYRARLARLREQIKRLKASRVSAKRCKRRCISAIENMHAGGGIVSRVAAPVVLAAPKPVRKPRVKKPAKVKAPAKVARGGDETESDSEMQDMIKSRVVVPVVVEQSGSPKKVKVSKKMEKISDEEKKVLKALRAIAEVRVPVNEVLEDDASEEKFNDYHKNLQSAVDKAQEQRARMLKELDVQLPQVSDDAFAEMARRQKESQKARMIASGAVVPASPVKVVAVAAAPKPRRVVAPMLLVSG